MEVVLYRKTLMKKNTAIIFSVVLAVGLLAWFASRRSPADGPIKVGILLPLTGDGSSYGQKGRKAIEMALDDFNARDSAGAKKVVAVFEDSKSNAKDGVSAVQKLITVDKVPAVVGDALSSVTLPAAAVAEANQVVLLSPCSSAPALTQAGKYIYRIWPSDLAEGKAAAEYAVSRGFKKAALLHLNNDYGNDIAEIFAKQFASDSRKIILKSAYADTTTDWRTMVTPLASSGADVVYIAGYYKDTAAILRTATELGIKVQFIGTTAIEDAGLFKLAGGAAEGIVYPLATGFDAASPDPASKAFVASFQKRFGDEPGWMESHAYDAFMLICNAIKSSKGKVSGTVVREHLDHLGTYHGVTGDIKFDENGDVIRGVVLKTVKDGKFVPLTK
jgi:branched-chain amino acid transport system substrate-binding protein